MRGSPLALILFIAAVAPAAATRHWAETANETLWRGRYSNCDKGYVVNLPPKVVGHGSHSPNPNHGILISAAIPASTVNLSLEEDQVIDIYDSYDASELGSARAYLNFELTQLKPLAVPNILEITFHGLPAIRARYQIKRSSSKRVIDEVIIFRSSPQPIFYVISLRTSIQHYDQDLALYGQIRDGFQLRAVPRGECSND
jgi:hypothetical protein